MRVLIVEDESALAETIAQGLREEEFAVDIASDGEVGLHMATVYEYDALVLDRMLPVVDGLELLRRLREAENTLPVLMLTARAGLEDRLDGFRAGTDDYLAKPFAFEELLARLRALIRRSHGVAAGTIALEDLSVDLDRREVMLGGIAVDLTATEYNLFEHLILNRGRVVSRTEISEHLWSHDAEKLSNVVDVHVANLRRKLGAGRGREIVRTVRGAGFLIEGEAT